MPYIWELKDWPHFTWDAGAVHANSYRYALNANRLANEVQPLSDQERADSMIELMVAEAQKTSRIEGETINPEAIRSSILKQLGLAEEDRWQDPDARGIARLVVLSRQEFAEPLTVERLCSWHRQFLGERIRNAGRWRTEPIRIVSGVAGKEKVHFEGPPASRVAGEMATFLQWFNASTSLPGPVRSGVAHLYFESIHPFEDGNGRMGRIVAEIALSQELGYPAVLSLSAAIDRQRKEYYQMLNQASRQSSMDITGWLEWWTQCVLDSQEQAWGKIAFVIRKAAFWRTCENRVNDRQEKVLARMLREGPEGFKGGMSARKYVGLTGCSDSTATRDLSLLASIGALERLPAGGRSTRYVLRLPGPTVMSASLQSAENSPQPKPPETVLEPEI